jgi:hypothetical protein
MDSVKNDVYRKQEVIMNSRVSVKAIKCALLVLCFITFGTIRFYPMVFANYAEVNFLTNPTIKSVESGSSMEGYIVDGAVDFLKSYTFTLTALQRIEASSKSALDYNELRSILKNAIGNMNGAVEIYRKLKTLSENTPYNPVMIDRLRVFDYGAFRESKGLNGFTLDNVEKYLSAGDVRGVISKFSSDSEALLKMLQELYYKADTGSFPDIQAVWQLNRVFSETLQFGQISAEVFYEISK